MESMDYVDQDCREFLGTIVEECGFITMNVVASVASQ